MSPDDASRISRRYRPWYRRRGILMIPIVVVMVLCVWNEYENHIVQFTCGPGFFLAGLALRVWAQMHLRYRLDVQKVLTSTGPYAYLRNPIYVANTLILVGVCFLSELLWFLPVVVLVCLGIYSMVVRYEEAHLVQKFGEPYLEYMRRVHRWLPRLTHREAPPRTDARRFFWPSVRAELHNFIWFVIPVIKEIISELS